jgi:hypothetical protein
MAFSESVLVKDPDPVFDWIETNVAAGDLIRKVARGVNYEAWKAGAIISVCPPDDPNFGWVVKIIVKNRETVDRIVSAWKARVDRCDVLDLDVTGP